MVGGLVDGGGARVDVDARAHDVIDDQLFDVEGGAADEQVSDEEGEAGANRNVPGEGSSVAPNKGGKYLVESSDSQPDASSPVIFTRRADREHLQLSSGLDFPQFSYDENLPETPPRNEFSFTKNLDQDIIDLSPSVLLEFENNIVEDIIPNSPNSTGTPCTFATTTTTTAATTTTSTITTRTIYNAAATPTAVISLHNRPIPSSEFSPSIIEEFDMEFDENVIFTPATTSSVFTSNVDTAATFTSNSNVSITNATTITIPTITTIATTTATATTTTTAATTTTSATTPTVYDATATATNTITIYNAPITYFNDPELDELMNIPYADFPYNDTQTNQNIVDLGPPNRYSSSRESGT